MKKFMLLHVGFEKPTPQIMAAWGAWFKSVADKTLENVGLRAAREVTKDGVRDLPWGADSLTGYTIIEVESMEEAEALARTNPFISSIRVYELVEH